MSEGLRNIYKEAGLCVEKTELASDSRNFNGVLIRESLPPFFVHFDDGTSISVPAFPYYKLKQTEKDKWLVLADYVQKQMGCSKEINLDFLYSPMSRFLHEYECLRQNGMFNFVRATINKQVSFHFYQTEYETEGRRINSDKQKQENVRAIYDPEKRTINFNCSTYYVDDDSSNVLVHEMCHCVMDDVNVGPSLGTMVLSDACTTWCQFIKTAVFLGDVRWGNIDKEKLKHINNFKSHFMPMFRELNDSWQVILSYDSFCKETTSFSELFAYMMGSLCANKKLVNLYDDYGESFGLRLLCDLSESVSNNDLLKQKCILQTLQNYKVSTDVKGSLISLKDLQIDILSAGNYTTDEYVELFYAFEGCCFHFEKEYREIQKKINRMYCKCRQDSNFVSKEVIMTNLQGALIHASDTADRMINRKLFHQIANTMYQQRGG